MELYHLLDPLLTVMLCSRLIAYYFKGGTLFRNLELSIYIIALNLNLVVHLAAFEQQIQFNFIHAVIPIGVICSILLSRHISSTAIVLLVAGLSACNLFFLQNHLIILLYQISILLLVLRGLRLASSRSRLISKAPTYFALAFDQLLTLAIFIFSQYDEVWQPSTLMSYWEFGSKIAFTLILVIIHVRFSRHYST